MASGPLGANDLSKKNFYRVIYAVFALVALGVAYALAKAQGLL